jgi:tRNA(His) 5'-end guanylyltransferase
MRRVRQGKKGSKDSLGDRMKRYESAARSYVTPRTPIIIRVDGKSFHTYTSGLGPFDENVSRAMVKAAQALCYQIQGAQLAYTQSDEISVLIHPYKRFESSAWFDGAIQKIASVSASIAAATFTADSGRIFDGKIKPAFFDSRVIVMPEAEVCNYFIWRQQDCTRNSVQSMARSVFSHKQCDGKNQDELTQMLRKAAKAGAGRTWESLAQKWTHGIIVERELVSPRVEGSVGNRHKWIGRSAAVPFVEHRAQVEDYLATEENETRTCRPAAGVFKYQTEDNQCEG